MMSRTNPSLVLYVLVLILIIFTYYVYQPILSPTNFETPIEHASTLSTPSLPFHANRLHVHLLTHASDSTLPQLRNLIGSIHLRSKSHVLISTDPQLPQKNIAEIHLWEHTRQRPSMPQSEAARIITNLAQELEEGKEAVVYIAPEYTLGEHGSARLEAILQKKGYIFEGENAQWSDEDRDLKTKAMVPRIFGFVYHSTAYNTTFLPLLQCVRQHDCDISQIRPLERTPLDLTLQTKLKSPSEGYCYVNLREDLLYTLISESQPRTRHPSKQQIAIGMPTFSGESLKTPLETAPITQSIPSFLQSLTDMDKQRFQFTIYIGYDEGDRYFDTPEGLAQISAKITEMTSTYDVAVRYIKFPFTKGWVTYIWNGLFAYAMQKDQADYFYQINDDLTFVTTGWASQMIDALKSTDDLGVSGPSDQLWKGRLFTQALVSKKHWTIFGKFFPTEIKDWFSDNWITEVYAQKYRHPITCKVINNNSQGTRYRKCIHPPYDKALKEGRALIAEYLSRPRPVTI